MATVEDLNIFLRRLLVVDISGVKWYLMSKFDLLDRKLYIRVSFSISRVNKQYEFNKSLTSVKIYNIYR